MSDQENFKKLLQHLIIETENENITSADEIIKLIVHELQQSLLVQKNKPAIH